MGLLSSKPQSYLGVDIGGESIKVVELANHKGHSQLVTYGIGERKINKVGAGEENIDEIVDFLLEVCKQAKITTNNVITALPTFAVFSSIITLPEVAPKELESAIAWEAKKVIPLPLKEMIYEWRILTELEEINFAKASKKKVNKSQDNVIEKKSKKQVRVLLTAAPKNLVKRYVNIFKKAELNLVSLETESFALTRALIGGDKNLIMLIDIGAVNTNISMIDQGVPLFNRGIEGGGLAVSKAIQQVLGLSPEYSEQFKRDLARSTLNKSDNVIMPKALETALAPVFNEIKYINSLFSGETEGLRLSSHSDKPEKIILTGGAAILPYITQHLSKVLDIKVIVGDPWARVEYPEDLRYVLEEVGPKLSVAIGLAMRNVK